MDFCADFFVIWREYGGCTGNIWSDMEAMEAMGGTWEATS